MRPLPGVYVIDARLKSFHWLHQRTSSQILSDTGTVPNELVIFMTCHRANATELPLDEKLTIKQLSMLLQLVVPIHVKSTTKKFKCTNRVIALVGVPANRTALMQDTVGTIDSLTHEESPMG